MASGESGAPREHAAECGLFCPGCGVFIATRDNPKRLEEISAQSGRPIEDVRCEGCNSTAVSRYCRTCTFKSCAREKGIKFCGECDSYPCDALKQFQQARPHRYELWEAQERIKQVGYDQWYMEMTEHFSCKACGAMNSAYHLACWKCGAKPGCGYVERHQERLIRDLGVKA